MLDFIKKNIFITIIFTITLSLGFLTFLTFIDKSFIKLSDQNLQFLLIVNIGLLILLFIMIFYEVKNSLKIVTPGSGYTNNTELKILSNISTSRFNISNTGKIIKNSLEILETGSGYNVDEEVTINSEQQTQNDLADTTFKIAETGKIFENTLFISDPGIGYSVGDTITINSEQLGTENTKFTINISGITTSINVFTPGTKDKLFGSYQSVPTTGTNGTDLKVN